MSTVITLTQGFEAGGKVNATGTVPWSELSSSPYGSWSSWTSWNPVPNDIIIEVEEDTGQVSQKTPLLSYLTQGDVSLQLIIGNTRHPTTGAVVAHTTINFAANTDYDYDPGRFYKATITVSGNAEYAVPEVQTQPKFTYTTDYIVEHKFNVNTATLGGTIDNRPVTTDIIGTVIGVIITPQERGVTYSSGQLQDRVYAVPDDYVFQENAIIGNVVSKSPLAIRCFDLNGESIDAVVDLQIHGLAEIRQGPNGIIAA